MKCLMNIHVQEKFLKVYFELNRLLGSIDRPGGYVLSYVISNENQYNSFFFIIEYTTAIQIRSESRWLPLTIINKNEPFSMVSYLFFGS